MHRMFMENKREAKGSKFRPFDGVGIVSPINFMNAAGSWRSRSVFDPYASDSSDSPSPLMKFLCSVDPVIAGTSSPGFVTPVKVEEDVIVMDGISVTKSNKGIGEVRMRSPLMPSNSLNRNFGKSNSTFSSSSSSGSGGRRGLVENRISFKNRLCHFWETSGICQFGSECQFAHGKEELRYQRSSSKIKHEISKLNSSFAGSTPSSPSPSPSPYGSKFPRNSQFKAAAAEEALSSPSLLSEMAFPASSIPAGQHSGTSGIPNTTPLLSPYWIPQDDGIEVTLPYGSTVLKSPSREEVNAYIENVLYGSKSRKRLPVFVKIFPNL